MIKFPFKRVYGLIGAPRAGKSIVGQYLQESRDFASMAFADKIKEEYGITNEDFEAAKVTGEIDLLRQELWAFSAGKKEDDPEYFIKLVMEKAAKTEQSVVVTDIRTENEFNALFKYLPADMTKKVYIVGESAATWESIDGEFSNYRMKESKISRDFYCSQFSTGKIGEIENKINGLHRYFLYLNSFFFKEDVINLVGPNNYSLGFHKWKYNDIISSYLSQFDVTEHI